MILDVLVPLAGQMLEQVSDEGPRAAPGQFQLLVAWLLICSGPAFYRARVRRYRNRQARHRHEAETRTSVHDVVAHDQFLHRNGLLRESRARGADDL